MTIEKTMGDDNEQSIELSIIIKSVIEKWRVVLACVIICSLIGIIVAALTYVPHYTSTISYVINPKDSSNGMTTNDFQVAENLANTYSRVMKGRTLIRRIQAETGIDESITGYISSELIASSNIMEVRVRTTDSDKSYAIAKALNEYLPEEAKRVVQTGSLDVFETPLPALKPDANNNLKRMGFMGALLGFILSVAIIALFSIFRRTVMTPEEITGKIDISHIGSVPHVGINVKKDIFGKTKKSERHEPMLITNKKTGFVFSETYKSMRTKIERYAKKHESRVILVTSALENEGKTTVAVNIALTLAQNGNRVILVDCDLRKPAVATVLDAKDKITAGTTEVLSGLSELENAIITMEKLRVDVIGGLNSVENSSEILSTPALKKMLDSLREKYDYVILDTPPSLLFTDSSILAEETDASILVVRQNTANIEDVMNVISDLSQVKSELMGFVFNNVADISLMPAGNSRKYGNSYYGYGK